MGLIGELKDILESGNREYREYKEKAAGTFCVREEILSGTSDAARMIPCEEGAFRNRLGLGDNAAYMTWLLQNQDLAGKIRMVYIDPPFFSKASYDAVIRLPGRGSAGEGQKKAVRHLAYEDIWGRGLAEYLTMLTSRLFLIRDLLTRDGTIWVHLDWHAVHYVRLLMDEIFGPDHFVNEIIWTYKSGGSSKKHFARKHDTILVYSKSKSYFFQSLTEKSYNRGMKPYRFKGVEEFQDETGWYTMVNMKDVWQIDMVGRTSGERNGYATQKPEALLERILACSSEPGDICADFFCGSGTLAAAAQKMGRRWICCDKGELAVSASMKRMLQGADACSSIDMVLDMEQGKAEEMEEETGGSLSARRDGPQVVLTGYTPPKARDLMLEGEGLKAVEDLIREDPLQLIDYWSVDFHYDGIHRPERFVFRGKDGCLPLRSEGWHEISSGDGSGGAAEAAADAEKGATEAEAAAAAGSCGEENRISVVAVDLLGNRVQRIIT